MDDRKGPQEGDPSVHDGVGPPVPEREKWLGAAGKTMMAVGLGGIAFFAIVTGAPHRLHGAPASARLELERRRAEIERAVREAERSRRGRERAMLAGEEQGKTSDRAPEAEAPRE